MGGLLSITLAIVAFLAPLALPLFASGWRALALMTAVAAAFFTWLSFDIAGGASVIGEFVGGLMLIGFAFGAIAKFAMLLGRPRS